ncbi:MAG: PqqD family protein [Acidobacteriota bacterium]
MGDDVRFRRDPSIRFEPLDDGCAVYDQASGRIYILNSTAALLWSGCDGQHSVGTLIEETARVLRKTGVTAQRVRRDAHDLFAELVGAGLLSVEESGRERAGKEQPCRGQLLARH